MKVLAGQLGSSSQRLLTVPRGTTLTVSTADTPADITVDLPNIIAVEFLGTISSIARNLFATSEIGLALQSIFGRWLTILDSITTPEGPTWHLIEGPIQLPFQPFSPLKGLAADQAILGLGKVKQ